MSKEAMISFPKKKVLEVDDFDFQMKSQEGTKVIKLSNFNETELGESNKSYTGVRKENQEFVEFLEAGPPNSQPEQSPSPTKRLLFGWKKKPTKKEEDEFRGNSPSKMPPVKVQVNTQVMPQPVPIQKLQSQRVASAPKSQVVQPAQQSAPNQFSNQASFEQPAPPKIQPEAPAMPPAEEQKVQPEPEQPDPYEEEAQLYAIDPVLMKNTDFNAAFIHVDDLGKTKLKNNSKGVKFAATVDTISSESYSDGEDEVAPGKPTFAPRGSSMKNLDTSRSATSSESSFPSRTEASRPQHDQSPLKSKPPMLEPEINFQDNRQSLLPKPVVRSRSFDEGVYPSQHPSTMPAVPVNSKTAFPAPSQQRGNDPKGRKMSDTFQQPLRKMSDTFAQPTRKMSDNSIPFSRKMSENSFPYSRKTSDASRTSDVSAGPISTSDKSLQTDADDRESLLSMISSLQSQLQNAQEENIRQQSVMQDQKKGFDKLSAQAYKKIKELLTDRNIMTIELTSLRAQITKMENQYDEWSVDVEE